MKPTQIYRDPYYSPYMEQFTVRDDDDENDIDCLVCYKIAEVFGEYWIKDFNARPVLLDQNVPDDEVEKKAKEIIKEKWGNVNFE